MAGSGNVVHRFGGYFRDAKRRNLAALDRWRTLWGQTGRAMDREFDPMFRVWPDGYELQETYARDFQPRFERNKATGQRITEKDIGANHEQLPYALINIFDRAAATPDLAAKPRGMPRILRVHQKDGPYKTLEAAFADVRDEEIIEIADNGDYVPGRNFGRPDQGVASADTAVIAIPVANLTLRASDGCRPTITLDERRQEALGTRSLLLFYTSEVQSLQISGIHFHIRQAKGKAGGIVFGTGNLFWRWDNCSFTDASDGAQETPGRAYGKAARFQAIHKTQAVWIENNAYFLSPGLRLSIGIQGANWVLTRNCLSDGPFLGCSMHEALKDRAEISLVNCSVFGTPVSLWLSKPADQIRLKSTRNLFLQVSGSQFVSIEPSAGMARVSAEGSENLISWSNKPLNEAARSTGAGKLLPGPSAKRVPDFEGPRDPKNPYQPYRLKKGQEAGKMAADGGPVGVRFEYLPDPPALPPEFFQQQ